MTNIVFMRPANERRRYIVTSSLIGWVHKCTLCHVSGVHVIKWKLWILVPSRNHRAGSLVWNIYHCPIGSNTLILSFTIISLHNAYYVAITLQSPHRWSKTWNICGVTRKSIYMVNETIHACNELTNFLSVTMFHEWYYLIFRKGFRD